MENKYFFYLKMMHKNLIIFILIFVCIISFGIFNFFNETILNTLSRKFKINLAEYLIVSKETCFLAPDPYVIATGDIKNADNFIKKYALEKIDCYANPNLAESFYSKKIDLNKCDLWQKDYSENTSNLKITVCRQTNKFKLFYIED